LIEGGRRTGQTLLASTGKDMLGPLRKRKKTPNTGGKGRVPDRGEKRRSRATFLKTNQRTEHLGPKGHKSLRREVEKMHETENNTFRKRDFRAVPKELLGFIFRGGSGCQRNSF